MGGVVKRGVASGATCETRSVSGTLNWLVGVVTSSSTMALKTPWTVVSEVILILLHPCYTQVRYVQQGIVVGEVEYSLGIGRGFGLRVLFWRQGAYYASFPTQSART